MRSVSFGLIVLACLATSGCSESPNEEALRAEIVALHQSFIQAHLDKDAAYLAAPTAPDYVSVASGGVRRMDAAAVEEMLRPYLQSTEFTHYEDVEDPIVGFSDDGSLAWSIVQVRVAGTRTVAPDDARSFDTRWAWISLFRRHEGRWQRLVDVSTNRPYEDEP